MDSKKKLAKTEIKLHFLTIFFFPTYEPCWLTSTTTTVKTPFLSHSSSICHQEEETIVSFSQELRKSLVIVIKAPFTHFSQRKRNEVAHWLAFPLQRKETLGITMFENHSKRSLIRRLRDVTPLYITSLDVTPSELRTLEVLTSGHYTFGKLHLRAVSPSEYYILES